MVEKLQSKMNDSKAMRWTALILVSFVMLAAYFFSDMMAPLQGLLEKLFGWQPDAYGFFSGSQSMLNVIFLFLILSGIILDKMGIRFTGYLSTITMLVGGTIKYYALTGYFNHGGFGYSFFNSFWINMPPSVKMASFGYAIFGVGLEMCGITATKAIVKWFKGKELALAMGMQVAIARLGTSVALSFSAKIAGEGTSSPNPLNTVFFGLSLLAASVLAFLVYSFMDKKIDKQISDQASDELSEEFHIKDLGKIITNPGFIIISLLCVLFYSGVFPFLKYAVNMMENKINISSSTSGYISSLLPIGTIILTPIFGNYLDRKGKAASMMILGACLLTLAHLTFAIVPLNMFFAILAIMVIGVAFSLVPAAMWPCVPKIVEERYLGSAYALVFWIQNIGLWLIPMLIGFVLKAVNPGIAERIQAGDLTAHYNYTIPMLVFSALGLSAIFLAYVLKAVDKKKKYNLELPNKMS